MLAQIFKIPVDPLDRLRYSFFEGNAVSPIEFTTKFRAIKLVGGIFPQPFTDHLHVVFKVAAQARTNHLNQSANGDYAGSRDMVRITGPAAPRHSQCCVGYIPDVNKRPLGKSPSMQLQFAAQSNEKYGPGDDPIELLTGSIHVGSSGEHDREIVGLMKCPKAHVRRRARHRVRRARIEWRVFFDETTGASAHFRRGAMDIFLQECAFAQTIVEPYCRDYIRHEPMVRVSPALRDHALSREIDHIARLFGLNKTHDVFEIIVDIELAKLKTARSFFPPVGEESLMRFRRSAYAEDPRSAFQ